MLYVVLLKICFLGSPVDHNCTGYESKATYKSMAECRRVGDEDRFTLDLLLRPLGLESWVRCARSNRKVQV